MRIVKLLLLLVLLSNFSHAQETTGLIFGKHNGILATKINPAFSLRSQHNWELQLIGGHAFMQGDYAFINNSSLIKLLNNYSQIEIPASDAPIDQYDYPIIFKRSGNSYTDAKAEGFGPGLLLKLKNGMRIGLSAKARAYGAAHDIPEAFNYYTINNLIVDSTYRISPFEANAAAWTEYQFHIAKKVDDGNSIGITAKYINAYHGAFLDNDVLFDFNRSANNILNSLNGGNIKFAYTNQGTSRQANGKGLALDIGIVSKNIFPFDAIVGISLLDLGYMSFSGNSYNINFQENTQINASDYDNIQDYNELLTQLEYDFVSIDSSQSFKMYLPTALSIQYIKPLNDHFSFEGSIVQRIKYAKKQLSRSNSVHATLLYERNNFSAFLPLSVYDYKHLRVGAALRFYFVTIGSDYLTSVISNEQDFSGTDVYVNLKLYPFWNKKVNNAEGASSINCYF